MAYRRHRRHYRRHRRVARTRRMRSPEKSWLRWGAKRFGKIDTTFLIGPVG